jgi:hypothetical protein
MREKEKGEESFQFEIRAVKLYLEDIENIIKFINNKNIEISDENCIYDSLADLKKNGPRNLNALSIASVPSYERPSISIEIKRAARWRGGVNLRASPDAEYQFLKIKELLRQKKQWHSFLSSAKPMFVGMVICFISFLIYFVLKNTIMVNIAITLFIFVIIYFFINMYYDLIMPLTSINIFYRNETPSFWIRNKDSLIVATLSAIIGGIIVGLLMQNL